MAIFLTLNESSASSRVVPMWCVQSNGTSAATNESGATFNFSIGGVYYGSGGSLSAVSANMGFYTANFSASKISVMGQGFVMYSSGTALPTMTPIMVVPWNSHDSMRLGLFALPNSAPNVSGGLPQLGTDYGSLLTVGVSNIKAANYSGVSVEVKAGGIQTTSLGLGNYSGVTVGVNSIALGTSSGLTVVVNNSSANTYSGVTVGVGGIAAGTYSGVTVGINNIAANTYSGVTVGINNIAANSYSGVTIQGVSNVS